MDIPQPTTQTMKASDARQHFSDVLNRVFRKEARVVVESSGIAIAAIVSEADLKRLTRLDAKDRAAWDVLAAMREPFRGVPPKEIERETNRILAEMRTEDRQQQEAATTG